MGIHLSDWVENIVGKGDIAGYEQFVLFPQCFPQYLLLMRQNEYLRSKGLCQMLLFHATISEAMASRKRGINSVKMNITNLQTEIEAACCMGIKPATLSSQTLHTIL